MCFWVQRHGQDAIGKGSKKDVASYDSSIKSELQYEIMTRPCFMLGSFANGFWELLQLESSIGSRIFDAFHKELQSRCKLQ